MISRDVFESSSSGRWTPAEEAFVLEYARTELSDEALEWYGEGADGVRIFSCVALGAVLAERQRGQMTEAELQLALAHLPGFILLSEERIEVLLQ